eukprot:scaffold4962_cov199-Chaetoceros_neogracile.AAC.2
MKKKEEGEVKGKTVVVGCRRSSMIFQRESLFREKERKGEKRFSRLSSRNPIQFIIIAQPAARHSEQHNRNNIMTTPAILTTRLRQLGHCPPSLLAVEETKLDDSFLVKVSNLVQDGVKLRENATVQEIQECLESPYPIDLVTVLRALDIALRV